MECSVAKYAERPCRTEHLHRYSPETDPLLPLQRTYGGVDALYMLMTSCIPRPHTPWRVPQRFWDMYTTEDIALATHKLPPKNMPGVAWMAHSFYNASTGGVFPLNVTLPLEDHVAQVGTTTLSGQARPCHELLERASSTVSFLRVLLSSASVLASQHEHDDA